MKPSYSELLRDPRWQKKRLEVLEKNAWKCKSCEDTESTLNVHHRYYVSHRRPWEYPDFCYQVLCESCHHHVKFVTEEARSQNRVHRFCWESGLDYFGDDIFDMMVEDELEKGRKRVADGCPKVIPI